MTDIDFRFWSLGLFERAEILLSLLPAALFFKVEISGDLPTLAKPETSAGFTPLLTLDPSAGATSAPGVGAQGASPPPPAPANSIRVWLRCP